MMSVSVSLSHSLIRYGEDDHFTRHSSLELHSILPQSELHSLPGGHLPHVSSPILFSRLCLDYLERTRSISPLYLSQQQAKGSTPTPQPEIRYQRID